MKLTVLFLGTSLSLSSASAGELLVGNKSDNTVWRLDLADGRRLGDIASGQGPHEIAVSPDGRIAIVTNYGHGRPGDSLTVIDTAGGRATTTVDLGMHTRPHGARFLPDGDLLVTTEQSRVATSETVFLHI